MMHVIIVFYEFSPWHARHARIGHGTQGHVAEPHEPTRRAGGAQVAQTLGNVTRVHADARVVPRGEKDGR